MPTYEGREAIEKIREQLALVTQGDWTWEATDPKTHDEQTEYVSKLLAAGEDGPLWCVGAGDRCVAITGNGPDSRANALFLAMAPQMIRFLLDELDKRPAPLPPFPYSGRKA